MKSTEIKEEIVGLVIKEIDMSYEIKDEEIYRIINEKILEYSRKKYISLGEKEKLRQDIFNSIRRLDVIQELLEDDSITEIMVNGYNNIFIEKEGRISRFDGSFSSSEKLLDVIQQIVAGCNRIVNEATPIVDGRLLDGSRINIVLPPVAIDGAAVTIRKFPKTAYTMEDLVDFGTLEEVVAKKLKILVQSGYNIFISGGTGSGKTTFLNALSNFIPKDERIITIEDSAELKIEGIDNLVRLEMKNENVEGKNEIAIKDLIKTALRMRPSRIIVGEVRDKAAFDMIQAMNTGHQGSLSTGHSNSATDMLKRLESMILMAAPMPVSAIRQQIGSAIDIIIHVGRLRDKSRKVLEICEILGYEQEQIKVNVLYKFKEEKECQGRIIGGLEKINELTNKDKIYAAGFGDYI